MPSDKLSALASLLRRYSSMSYLVFVQCSVLLNLFGLVTRLLLAGSGQAQSLVNNKLATQAVDCGGDGSSKDDTNRDQLDWDLL